MTQLLPAVCSLLPLQVLAAQHDWPALQALAGRAAGDRKLGLSMEHFIAAARWEAAEVGRQRWPLTLLPKDAERRVCTAALSPLPVPTRKCHMEWPRSLE